MFLSVEKREKQMKMDSAVDEIRRRFGFYSIQRGLMYRDRILSAVNAKRRTHSTSTWILFRLATRSANRVKKREAEHERSSKN